MIREGINMRVDWREKDSNDVNKVIRVKEICTSDQPNRVMIAMVDRMHQCDQIYNIP